MSSTRETVWQPTEPVAGRLEYDVPREGDVVRQITVSGLPRGSIAELCIEGNVVWTSQTADPADPVIVPVALNLLAIGYHSARLTITHGESDPAPRVSATYVLFDSIEHRRELAGARGREWWRFDEKHDHRT